MRTPLSERSIRLATALAMSLLLVLVPAAAASASSQQAAHGPAAASLLTDSKTADLPGVDDPTFKKLPKKKQQEILKKARKSAAATVCDKIPGLGRFHLDDDCERAVGPTYSVAAVTVSLSACSAIFSGVPVASGILIDQCNKIFSRLLTGKGWDAFKGTILQEAAKAAKAAIAVAKFIANPAGAIDDLANKLKEFSVSLLQNLMTSVTSYQSASLGSAEFRTQYAQCLGIGVFVFALMFLLTCLQLGRGEIDSDEFMHSVGVYGPLGVLLMVFGPALGYAFQVAVNGLCDGIAHAAGTTITEFVAGILNPIRVLTVEALPGGSFAGVVVFGLMALGTCTAFFAMLMQNFGMYMISAVISIGFAMMINPRWRSRSRKMGAAWGAVLLFKPAFLLLLFLAFGFLKLPVNGVGIKPGEPMANFLSIVTIAGVLLIMGMSPLGLFRFMPLMPGGNEPTSGGSGAMAALGGAAGSALTTAAMNRSGGGGVGKQSSSSSPTQQQQSSSQQLTTRSQGPSGGGQRPWQQTSDAGGQGKDGKDGQGGQGGPAGPMRVPQTGGGQQGGQQAAAAASKTSAGAGAGAGAGGAAAAAGPVGAGIAAAAQVAQAARAHGHKSLDDASGGGMREVREGES